MMRRPLPKIMRSYGCQLGVFEYLSELEVLQLQLIDRDSYERTIARCLYTFHIRNKMLAFTYHSGNRLSKSIILLNDVTGAVQNLYDDRLSFKGT